MGGARLIQLVDKLGGIDSVVAAGQPALRQAGLDAEAISAIRNPDSSLLDLDINWLAESDHHLLTWDSDRYPALLRDTPSPPAALFVEGDPNVLWQPQIAVIGSRNPTTGGRENRSQQVLRPDDPVCVALPCRCRRPQSRQGTPKRERLRCMHVA